MKPEDVGCKCASCPFAVDGASTSPLVLGEGPKDAEGVVVLDGPLDHTTHRQLNDELKAAGLDSRRLLFIHATQCTPPPGKRKDIALMQAAKACSAAVDAVKVPHVPIIAMGKAAAWAVMRRKLPKGGMEKARGFIRPDRLGTSAGISAGKVENGDDIP